MTGLLAALAGYATLLRLAWVVERTLTRRWDAQRSLDGHTESNHFEVALRDVAVREHIADIQGREADLKERLFAQQYRDSGPDDPMPAALVDRIHSWEDGFAQEQERATITALYSEYRDWKKVMQKLPPLSPSFSSDIAAPRDGLRDGLVQ
jgi:hypothetical protein